MVCFNSFIAQRRKPKLEIWGDSLKECARSVSGVAFGQNQIPKREVLMLPLIREQPGNSASISRQTISLTSP